MKLGLIKSVKIGEYILEHERTIDDFGVIQEFFILIKRNENGSFIKFPLRPPIKAKNFTKKSNILTDGMTNYSKKEMLDFLRGELKKDYVNSQH